MLPSPRMRIACLITLGLTLLSGAAFGVDKERRDVLARQKAHYLQMVASLPELGARQMPDLMQFHIDHGLLAFSTPLKPWREFEGRRATIDGLGSPVSVSYVQYVADQPAARQFEFKVEEYPDPETYIQLHLQWQPGPGGRGDELSIEETEQTAHSFLRVFYRQGPPMARLMIFSNEVSNDRIMGSENCTERDFLTLRQQYPSEVERYLRPMFHKMGQDVIFAPDDNSAWQVLADDWPVNDAVDRKVKSLLPALNDRASRVRNAAANQLAELGRDGAAAIVRLGRENLSLEQNVRLDEVLARFARLSPARATRLSNDTDFLLDCQYCDDTTVRDLAAARLARVLGHRVSLNPNAPLDERIETVDHVRTQLHPAATRPS